MLLNIDKPTRRVRLHLEGCAYVPMPYGTAFKPVGEMGRDGGWFVVLSREEAERIVHREAFGLTLVECPNCNAFDETK